MQQFIFKLQLHQLNKYLMFKKNIIDLNHQFKHPVPNKKPIHLK